MTTISQTEPRSLHDLAARVNCPQCWQRPGRPCTVTGPSGDHLARYLRAEHRGLITRAELADVIGGLDVIARSALIREPVRMRDGAR